MTTIERRCRFLLRAYPGSYRAERGDEILGTLLEASAPGRSWPQARDARALILGGLRVRARQHQPQTTGGALRQAVLFAAVLDLTFWNARDLGVVLRNFGRLHPALFAWLHVLAGLFALAVMAGAWFGRRVVVAVAALAAAGLWLYQPARMLDAVSQPVIPFAVVGFLVIRQRLPRSWLWIAGAWYLTFLWTAMFGGSGTIEALAVVWGVTVGAIGWSVIDARLMLATTLAVAAVYSNAVLQMIWVSAGWPFPWYLWPWFLPAILGVALAAAAIVRLRRQAVL